MLSQSFICLLHGSFWWCAACRAWHSPSALTATVPWLHTSSPAQPQCRSHYAHCAQRNALPHVARRGEVLTSDVTTRPCPSLPDQKPQQHLSLCRPQHTLGCAKMVCLSPRGAHFDPTLPGKHIHLPQCSAPCHLARHLTLRRCLSLELPEDPVQTFHICQKLGSSLVSLPSLEAVLILQWVSRT